jgi:catechol 2,3-dioxygenase-like lactoylglutathione lyase family enzyme
MLDHLGIAVANFAVNKAFYTAALAPLGMRITMEGDNWAIWSDTDFAQLWLGEAEPVNNQLHLAFSAKTRAQVQAFHAAALVAGGTDNGAPGLRKEYHPNYYGAFIIDPNGHNIEAVCHTPE